MEKQGKPISELTNLELIELEKLLQVESDKRYKEAAMCRAHAQQLCLEAENILKDMCEVSLLLKKRKHRMMRSEPRNIIKGDKLWQTRK